MTHWEDVPMFETYMPPVKVPLRQVVRGDAVWTSYGVKRRVKCDDCMLLLLQTKGEAPAARIANHRRVAGPTELLLCDAHAQVRREEDEK